MHVYFRKRRLTSVPARLSAVENNVGDSVSSGPLMHRHLYYSQQGGTFQQFLTAIPTGPF
jgi:hypothetical protein